MADKYRIAHNGSDFVVNYEAGGTVGVYETDQAAKQERQRFGQLLAFGTSLKRRSD